MRRPLGSPETFRGKSSLRARPRGLQPVLAKELVALQPDAIFTHATSLVVALQRESRTIPIVFAGLSDPIGSGLVASLPRPGGNVTGVMQYEASVSGKWLAMLKEIAPGIMRVGLVANPKTATYEYYLRAGEALGPSLGIDVVLSPFENAPGAGTTFLMQLALRPRPGELAEPSRSISAF